MAFDPLRWIDVADALDSDEAEWRTAAGRYYYGCFKKNLIALAAKQLYQPRGDRTDHRGVVRSLRSNRRGQAATALEMLVRLREHADYDTDTRFEQSDFDRAQGLAQQIVRLCQGDW